MEAKTLVECLAVLSIPITVLAVVYHRIQRKMGMGYRAIQFMGVPIAAALLLILALEKLLEGQALAAIVGAFVGYVLSGKGVAPAD